MATILQFAERLVEDGDWTPAERSQLRDMGAQLGQTAAGLDLVFGKTEEGDPWCVVADDRSEVLLHVARIGGGFVVHAPRNDHVIESHDLWLAVSRVLGGVLRDRRGLILPFAPDVMGQPTVLALMVAAAVRGDFTEIAQNALTAQSALPALAPHSDRAETAPVLPTHAQDAAPDIRHAAPLGAAETAAPADQHLKATPAAVAALTLVAASQTDARAIEAGAPAHDAAAGQAAAPAARAAPDAGQPTPAATAQTASPPASATSHLNGAGVAAVGGGTTDHGGGSGFAAGSTNAGAVVSNVPEAGVVSGSGPVSGPAGVGPDTAVPPTAATENAVVVQSDSVARGQAGTTDVFVLSAPVRTEGGNVISLGVVAGFSIVEGDRLVFANGAAPAIVQVIDLSPLSPSALGLTGDTARRIGYDFNGDGVEDAFVVVVDAAAPLVLHKAADTAGADLSVSTDHVVGLQGVAAGASITVVFIGQ